MTVVEVAVQEFKEKVMSLEPGTRREARALFVSKADAARTMGVLTDDEFWSILRSIRSLEEEDRSRRIKESMEKLDEALALCYRDVEEAMKQKKLEEEVEAEMRACQ